MRLGDRSRDDAGEVFQSINDLGTIYASEARKEQLPLALRPGEHRYFDCRQNNAQIHGKVLDIGCQLAERPACNRFPAPIPGASEMKERR